MLQKNENDAGILNNVAWLLAMKERNGAEALKCIERAIELQGPIASRLDTRAMAYLALGKATEAVKDLEEAIAQAPSASHYFHLAQAYHKLANDSHKVNDRNNASLAWERAKLSGLREEMISSLELRMYQDLRTVYEKR
jgi:tetratricopeptide (TPR) repeat protein